MPVMPAQSVPIARRANKAEVAEWFGVSLPAVDGWIRRGCPVLQKGSRGIPWVLDLLEVSKWRLVGSSVTEEGDVDPDKLPPADRDRWFASEIKRRQLQQEDGELLLSDDVRQTWAEALKAIVLALDTLGDVIERDAGLTPEQAAIVQRVVDEQREMLYQQITGDE